MMVQQSQQKRLDTLQTIELAEGVEIHAHVAGVFPRMLANLLDVLFIVLIWIALCLFVVFVLFRLSIFGDNWTFASSFGLILLMTFCLVWFYFYIFERGVKAATWGKRLLGLRVVSADGTRATDRQVIIRNLLRAADLMPGIVVPMAGLMVGTYGIGMLSCLFTKKFQRIGDLVAHTFVVYSNPYGSANKKLNRSKKRINKAAKRQQHLNKKYQKDKTELPKALTKNASENVPNSAQIPNSIQEIKAEQENAKIIPKMPRFALTRQEQTAIYQFIQRSHAWTPERQVELATLAEELTGKSGTEALEELRAYAKWIEAKK